MRRGQLRSVVRGRVEANHRQTGAGATVRNKFALVTSRTTGDIGWCSGLPSANAARSLRSRQGVWPGAMRARRRMLGAVTTVRTCSGRCRPRATMNMNKTSRGVAACSIRRFDLNRVNADLNERRHRRCGPGLPAGGDMLATPVWSEETCWHSRSRDRWETTNARPTVGDPSDDVVRAWALLAAKRNRSTDRRRRDCLGRTQARREPTGPWAHSDLRVLHALRGFNRRRAVPVTLRACGTRAGTAIGRPGMGCVANVGAHGSATLAGTAPSRGAAHSTYGVP